MTEGREQLSARELRRRDRVIRANWRNLIEPRLAELGVTLADIHWEAERNRQRRARPDYVGLPKITYREIPPED